MSILSALAPLGIAAALVVMGLLSKRMNDNTGSAKPYYRWFYVAAGLLLISAGARVVGALSQDAELHIRLEWVLLYDGLPALGITLGVFVAWRYWSWLLAERD